MRHLVKVGFVALPAWLIITTIAGFLATDYNPIASHVSVMTLQGGLAHSLANIAAWAAGLSLITFGMAIWRLSGRAFSAGGLCWIAYGIAMLANGTWPMGTPMHGLYILGIFNVLAPALSLLEIRDSDIKDKLLGLTAFVSLSSVLYIWILLNGFDPEGYSGLTQRVFGVINFLWPFAFAWTYYRSRTRA